MNVTLKFDTQPLSREFRRIAEGARNQAIPRAYNRAATSARAVMARAVAKDVGLKIGRVREEIQIVQANPHRLSSSLVIKGGRIPLIEFGAKGPEPSRGRGKVTAKTPTRRAYPGAFIATMHSGHRGVFRRNRRSRLPIRELRGPSLPHVFEKHTDAGVKKWNEAVMKNLKSEFRFLLKKATA